MITLPRIRPLWLAPLALWLASAAAAEPPPESDWSFEVAPYIWLPAMTGESTIRGNTADVDTSISDLFTETDFVFALQAQMEVWYKRRGGMAFNGKWTILQQDDNSVGPSGCSPLPLPCIFPVEFDLTMNMGFFEFLGFYSPGEWALGSSSSSPSVFVEPLVGARVTVMRVEFDVRGRGDLDATKS